jgi:hypothetical protein
MLAVVFWVTVISFSWTVGVASTTLTAKQLRGALERLASSLASTPVGESPDFYDLNHRTLAELVKLGRMSADNGELNDIFGSATEPFTRQVYFAGTTIFSKFLQSAPSLKASFHGAVPPPVGDVLDFIETAAHIEADVALKLRKAVVNGIAIESGIPNARGVWIKNQGPRLMRLAAASAINRQSLIVPWIMLLTGLGVADHERNDFVRSEGIATFCDEFGPEIRNALVLDHKQYHYIRKMLRSARREWDTTRVIAQVAFAADFISFCPSILTTLESRLVVQVHRHFRNRIIAEDFGAKPLVLDDVKRDRAFSSVSSKLSSLSGSMGLEKVSFAGEIGKGPGVMRDWFGVAASELFDKEKKNFELVSDGHYYQIDTEEGLFETKTFFKAIGTFFALSVVEQVPLGINLPVFLFEFFADRRITLEIAELDQRIGSNSMRLILNMEPAELDSADIFLTSSGAKVTTENRHILVGEWLDSLVPSKGLLGQAYQYMKEGFRSVIIDDDFNSSDIRSAILGHPNVDPADLIAYIELEGFEQTDKPIAWFFEALRSWDQATLRKWITFVTGYPTMPITGASGFDPRIKISKSADAVTALTLPRAQTCFNSFQLPAYASRETLIDRVLFAINSDGAMGIV